MEKKIRIAISLVLHACHPPQAPKPDAETEPRPPSRTNAYRIPHRMRCAAARCAPCPLRAWEHTAVFCSALLCSGGLDEVKSSWAPLRWTFRNSPPAPGPGAAAFRFPRSTLAMPAPSPAPPPSRSLLDLTKDSSPPR
ncbi:hypothetical protein ANO11243_013400 [Dothideomycetidae sp. 11243]|nr:hypothetical protein ANO11243_013400 [fungal sp. No.11243]